MKNKILLLLVLSTLLLTFFSFDKVQAQTIDYIAPYHTVQSPNGNIRIGSGSTGWAHVLTDRPKFYFQKEIRVNSGNIGSYDENLSLKTAGSTKMTILNSNGFVGIGILSPQARLHIASGTDVNLSGGGHLVLGSTAITNLALDNNEIQARNNGSASNLFLQLEGGSIGVGTASLPFKFNVAGDVYANGGWVRVGGNAGIYFQNHGGGFRMIDNTWIRTFGGKSFYHDTGIMRTDGIFQVGPEGNRFLVAANGNIGVGTTTPTKKLDVNGNFGAHEVFVNGGWVRVSGNTGIYFQNHGGGFRMQDSSWIRTFGGKSFYHDTGIMRTDGIFQVGPTGSRFLVAANGNVGIGTTTPDNKLDVKGRLRAEEVIVEEGWADFVFDDDYVLPTLEEEKHHIDLKGHLIGFESEEAMDGEIQIGDVTKRQQQKIEELVLHTIGLNEKVKEQQMINEKLKSELAAIKMLMDEIKTQLKD